MCTDNDPANPAGPVAERPRPEAQTFETTAEFLAAIKPGMHLCSSDFTGWGVVESVESVDTAAPAVLGVTNADQRRVRVPADALIDIRGGHCVRIDRVRATLDGQGWEI